MPALSSTALRLLRRILRPTKLDGPYAGEPQTLDGSTAVAIAEASVCEAAAISPDSTENVAALAWRTEQRRYGSNIFGAPLSCVETDTPRGALAAALGLATAGNRTTCFLSAADLAGANDLLAQAAGRRLPLVIHLSQKALGGPGGATGSGHETWHMIADSGCTLLFAANVQEAVDFTLVARRLAEQTLAPVVVAMDWEQTALAVQDVRLPTAELASQFLGRPGDEIPSPTDAQRLLFGERRRRLPRWHDPDHPVLLGAPQGVEAWGLGRAAAQLYLDPPTEAGLAQSLTAFARYTGRVHRPMSTFGLDDAKLVLLAQGAAIETAEAAAEYLRGEHQRVGVLGLRRLRPFPAEEVVRHLAGKRLVCVLERLAAPPGAEPPLLREIRSVLERATGPGESKAGLASRGRQQRPRLISVLYGLGGLPLRGADLVQLSLKADAIDHSQVFLGLTFSPTDSPYPKRQVLLDRLRRSYPEAASLGMKSPLPSPSLRPKDALTLAVHRLSDRASEGLFVEAAAFLQSLTGLSLRSRPGLPAVSWGERRVDTLTLAEAGLRDPGAETPVDLAVATVPRLPALTDAIRGLAPGGALLLCGAVSEAEVHKALGPRLAAELSTKSGSLHWLPPGGLDGAEGIEREYLLGAVCGLVLDTKRLDLRARRILSERERLLERDRPADQQALFHAFQAGMEAEQRLPLPPLPGSVPARHRGEEDGAPMAVRRLGRSDDGYDSLPRFWDQVGVLYQNAETDQLVPEPYLALGAVPPLSASLRDLSSLRPQLPTVDAGACTGCGACWSRCPDGAIGAAALSPRELLDAGIRLAGADALRPLLSRLVSRVTELCREPEPARLHDLLSSAISWLQSKTNMPEERRKSVQAAAARLGELLGPLHAAVAAPFFGGPRSGSEDPGQLLLLAVNPDACKGCGICVSACAPGALALHAADPALEREHERSWRVWEQLPETAEATRSRLAKQPEPGPLAALLLTPPTSQGMGGGDGAEPGSGGKLALRLILAVIQAEQNRLQQDFLRSVRERAEQMKALIRSLLADALPTDDLDILAKRLDTIEVREVDLASVLGPEEAQIGERVDMARLQRAVTLARGLDELESLLAAGRQGLGRAPVGLVLSPGNAASWIGAFPSNPFTGPVCIDLTGDGAQLAAGLLEGQLRQATEGFVLLRKAKLELEHPADAGRLGAELDALGWRDLSPEERAVCPPLLLVGDSGVLAGQGLAQVMRLMGGDLPLRMLLLADLDLGLAAPAAVAAPVKAVADPGIELPLLALAARKALVAQTSVADAEHLFESIQRAIRHPGPALLHLHAPSPGRHGFAPERTVEQAHAAVVSRAFPLFRYDPGAPGVFGSRIDLEDNPAPLAPWSAEEGAPATPADWMLGEERFAPCFTPLAADAADTLPLLDYLALGAEARRGKTPFVAARSTQQRQAARLAVSADLTAACERRLHAWRTLQELAGLVTPFTERVAREAAERVAAAHEAEILALKAEYEERIRRLQDETMEQLRGDIKDRLLAMTGYEIPAERPQA